MKKVISFGSIVLFAVVLCGCGTNKNTATTNANTATVNVLNTALPANTAASNSNASAAANTASNLVCQWVDDSDVIITLEFADGVQQDTSYEVGFYLSGINFFARLARKECGYRTGFSYDELKGKGAVQVGARGYTDSVRRQLADEPVSVVIGADGHPDIGSAIIVTVLD